MDLGQVHFCGPPSGAQGLGCGMDEKEAPTSWLWGVLSRAQGVCCVVSKPHLPTELSEKLAARLTMNWNSILILFYYPASRSRLPQRSSS